MLVQQGADLTLRCMGPDGNLYTAIQILQHPEFKDSVEHKAIARWLNAVRGRFNTPLQWACLGRDTERVLKLLRSDDTVGVIEQPGEEGGMSALRISSESEYPNDKPICHRTRQVGAPPPTQHHSQSI